MGFFNWKREATDKITFKCKDCNMVFNDKDRLKRHSRKAHTDKGNDMPNNNPLGF